MTDFVYKNLKDVITRIKVGFVGSVNEFYCDSEAGVPIIRTTDIDDINFGKLKFVTKEFHEKNKKSQLKNGDLIIARHGDNGNAVIYRHDRSAQVLNAVIIEPDQSKVTSDLLKIFFDSPFIKKQIKGAVKGSVQGVINTQHVSDLVLNFSDNINYDFVVRVITNLNRKLELNNKINAELEAMAKLIYDYWFVQFDFPDENGKPYKSSGGKMVYNKDLKRQIPMGWGAGKLSDFEQKIITGKTPSTNDKNNFDGDIPFICIGDVRGNMYITKTEITLTEVGAASQANKFIPKDAICVTCIASPGLVAFATLESQTNQQLNSVVCGKKENRYFLYFYLKNYFKFTKAKMGNTFANMNKDDFSSILLPYPKDEIVDSFSEKVKSVFESVLLNSQENNLLIELKDFLLPMLMNGEVTVSEARMKSLLKSNN
ncbi:MAG: restriction endonuclease subunit S [Flavobacteriales bacterium]|nr:restriction endonuclease subunit S [Flavobacteriales bacterium]